MKIIDVNSGPGSEYESDLRNNERCSLLLSGIQYCEDGLHIHLSSIDSFQVV